MSALTALAWTALAGPAHADQLRVSTVADEQPDGCEPGDCTLREAVLEANSDADEDVILLRPGVATGSSSRGRVSRRRAAATST